MPGTELLWLNDEFERKPTRPQPVIAESVEDDDDGVSRHNVTRCRDELTQE